MTAGRDASRLVDAATVRSKPRSLRSGFPPMRAPLAEEHTALPDTAFAAAPTKGRELCEEFIKVNWRPKGGNFEFADPLRTIVFESLRSCSQRLPRRVGTRNWLQFVPLDQNPVLRRSWRSTPQEWPLS